MGLFDEAKAALERRTEQSDPLSVLQQKIGAMTWTLSREYDKSLEKWTLVKELRPDESNNRWVSRVLLALGREEEAFRAELSRVKAEGASAEELEEYSRVFRESGLQGLDRLVLDQLDREQARPYDLAAQYAAAGEIDLAFEALDETYESYPLNVRDFFAIDARFDSLRTDPRYKKLLYKLNLPDEVIERHLAVY
jgi:tetratricopeptide (TPR) repeat protein